MRRLGCRLSSLIAIVVITASCTRPSVMLDAYLDKSGTLVIDTLPAGIIFKTRERPCVKALGIYDSDGTTWRIDSDNMKSCFDLPVAYGSSPRGSMTVVEAKPLNPSRRYGLHVTSDDRDGLIEFNLDRKGAPHFDDFRQTSTIREPLGVRFVGSSKRMCQEKEKRACRCVRYGCTGWEPVP
jgi:hypothetical protein